MADAALVLATVAERLPWAAPAVGAVLGAVAGSFIGCARYRLPRGMSLWRPPSSCMSCKRVLTWPDLIPVASWLALRGRCRSCGAPFGAGALALEIASAVVGVLLGYAVGPSLWFFPLVLMGLAAYAAVLLIL